MRLVLMALLMLISAVAGAQEPENDPLDSLGLARLKNYTAARVSSDNRYVFSNDDSKRIINSLWLKVRFSVNLAICNP